MKTSKGKLTIVLFITVLLPTILFTQGKATEIDKLMQTYLDQGRFNGTILVAENGEVIFKKGYGLANMEWNIPNQPDTKFRIASVTKQFTSMLIMQLVEEGKIKLDGKIIDYIPGYRKDTGDKVTIHHLLTHTSGIPNVAKRSDIGKIIKQKHTVDEVVKKYCSDDLESEPGTKYSYNASGYFLLGAIIEKITNKSYETVLKEKIFNPIGMNNSGYDYFESIIKNRAAGYQKSQDGYINAEYLDMSNPYAAGGLYSTVEDLYLWDQALYSIELLSKKYKEIMFTPFMDNYAYGWVVYKVPLGETADSLNVISHSGDINGFNSRIFRLVDDKHLIVVLNNTGNTDMRGICTEITNILYDMPYELPKISIALTIGKIILKSGIDAAIKKYIELKLMKEEEYNFVESQLNILGYQLLKMNRVKDAIEIFKLNVEEYPNTYNPYDSLGEAYLIDGQNDLAIKNYAKSLELNPDNTNAVEMLKNLKK